MPSNCHQIHLLLGGNIGKVQATFLSARDRLNTELGTISNISSIYQTAAWGVTDQPDFLNQVIVLYSSLPPQQVLEKTMSIEIELGRKRHEKWSARTIDIDILFYDDQIIQSENLKIPHPEIPNRRFTLTPLVEIAPDFIHPTLQKTMSSLLLETTDKLNVQKLN